MSINNRVKVLAAHLDLNISELAKATGIKQTTLNNIVTNGAMPRANTIELLLKHYTALNARWLITGTGEIWTKEEVGSHQKESTLIVEESKKNFETKSSLAETEQEIILNIHKLFEELTRLRAENSTLKEILKNKNED